MLRSAFGADALRFIDSLFELRPDLDKMGYVEALIARQGVARAWTRFQAERPLILGPVSTRSPFPVGRDLEGPAAGSEILESMRLVVAVNLLGLPAAAVPVGASGGLPQGVQIIGPRYREDLCLDAAQAIEDRFGILTPIDPV
jgi:amidase